jgi:hypothetical protein
MLKLDAAIWNGHLEIFPANTMRIQQCGLYRKSWMVFVLFGTGIFISRGKHVFHAPNWFKNHMPKDCVFDAPDIDGGCVLESAIQTRIEHFEHAYEVYKSWS